MTAIAQQLSLELTPTSPAPKTTPATGGQDTCGHPNHPQHPYAHCALPAGHPPEQQHMYRMDPGRKPPVTAALLRWRYGGRTDIWTDPVAWIDHQTTLADLRVMEAVQNGVPLKWIDPCTGRTRIPDNACHACWQPIDGPVVARAWSGVCRHYHPEHRPVEPGLFPGPLGELYTDTPHPAVSCKSTLPYYQP